MPTVSIIISSYNSAAYLPATIGSCLRQTVRPVEVIVIDDGSTDDTATVCQQFGDAIRYLREPNRGVSAARNHGAELATGDWLLFLDSDDLLLPTALESLLAATDDRSGVVYGMVIQRAEQPDRSRLNGFDYCAGEPPIPAQRNFRRCAIITPGSAIVRKDLHLKIGGFVTGYEPMEDRDYWIKCGLLAPVRHCDTVVLDKTWRESSAGANTAKRIYRSLLAQQNLRAWCTQRGVPFCWPDTDADLSRDALKEALFYRAFSVLDPLLAKCRESGYKGFWFRYASALKAALSFLKRLPETPAWVPFAPVLR